LPHSAARDLGRCPILSVDLAQLLYDPRRVGLVGHVEVNDPSSAMFDHEPQPITAAAPARAHHFVAGGSFAIASSISFAA
jgi:hypothetical protein